MFHCGSQASAFIRVPIAGGNVVHADEAGSWDNLHERFEVERSNHQEAYPLDGACTNWAEGYFSRLRRAEIGVHHQIAGAYLRLRAAQKSPWPEDNHRVENLDHVNRLAALAMKRGPARHPAACSLMSGWGITNCGMRRARQSRSTRERKSPGLANFFAAIRGQFAYLEIRSPLIERTSDSGR